MKGVIIGDVVGSYYEFRGQKGYDMTFYNAASTFTDDTILSLAVAGALLENKENPDYKKFIIEFSKKYSDEDSNGPTYITPSFGSMFSNWVYFGDDNDHEPYGSYGNGGAMRTLPVAWVFNDLETVIEHAALQSSVTHNHPDGVRGACAIAATAFLYKEGKSNQEISDFLMDRFAIDVNLDLDHLHKTYSFKETALESVPQAIACVMQATDFESVYRNVLYIGGDVDTLMAMAGGIADFKFHDEPPSSELIKYGLAPLQKYAPELFSIYQDFKEKFVNPTIFPEKKKVYDQMIEKEHCSSEGKTIDKKSVVNNFFDSLKNGFG